MVENDKDEDDGEEGGEDKDEGDVEVGGEVWRKEGGAAART